MTETVAYPARSEDRASLGRLTDPTWLAGGALWIAAGFLYRGDGWRFTTSSGLWLVADVLIATGIVRLLRLGAHGTGRIGAGALAAALVARIAFAGGEVTSLLQGHDDNPLIPIGALLTALSMTVYGVLAVRRGAARGAGRWAGLAMGLYPFAAMFPVVAVTGEPSPVLIALWGVPTALLGFSGGSARR